MTHTSDPLVKVNLIPKILLHRLVLFSVYFIYPISGDTAVQTGTGKVYPARKFKCTMAARVLSYSENKDIIIMFTIYIPDLKDF